MIFLTKKIEKIKNPLTIPFASRIPAALHKEMKIAAGRSGIRIQAIVANALRAYLPELQKKRREVA